MKKKILLSLCITLLLVTGCGKTIKLENGKDAVVGLKDIEGISIDDLYTELKDKYAIGILVDMIDEKILNQKYAEDEEQKESTDSQIKSWLQTFGSETILLQQTQSQLGISSMSELREYLGLQYKRGKAVEDYAKSIVTDGEIKKYYDDEVFGDIKASHILIKSEATSSMTDAEKANKEEEALRKAKEIITKLDAGEDFATLAKEYSQDDSNKEEGGDLGYFSKGKMVDEFEDAVKALKNGEYTKEPVKTSFGYHIVLKVDQKEKTSLDSIREDIIETISEDKLNDDPTLQITAMMKLREEYGMAIQDDVLKTQYEQLMTQQKETLLKNSQAN